MKSEWKCKKLIYAFLALFLLIITLIGGRGIIPAFADNSNYTGVLTDLQKDSNFNCYAYPVNSEDYSIQIIQIAESTNGELFVYTYQPCQMTTYLVATQINMSLTDKMGFEIKDENELTDEDKPKLYDLTLLNCSGVFVKYKVNGFTVGNDKTRYYNIASIYRAFDSNLDNPAENNKTISAVAYPVNTLYKAETVNGILVYSFEQNSVIQVVDKYVGMLRYSQGYLFGVERKCDSHYIAFSTEMQIEDLVEATVYFTTQSYRYNYMNYTMTALGDPEEHYVSMTSAETVSSGNFGFFANVHLWNRIQTVDEFCADVKLLDSALNEVKNKQWVLRFVETDYSDVYSSGGGFTQFVKIADTAILELTFLKDGKCYSLGVVDDKQTGSNSPDNPDTGLKLPFESDNGIGFWAYVWRCIIRLFNGTATLEKQIVAIVALFICLLALPILLIALSFVFPAFRAVVFRVLKAIGNIIFLILKGLWWLISAPFRGIVWIVRKIRGE